MTVQDFNIAILKKIKSEKSRNWISSIFESATIIFLILYINIKPDKLGNKVPISVSLILLSLLGVIFFSMYQLAQKKYGTTTILNSKTLEHKNAKIVAAFARVQVVLKSESGSCMTFFYQKNKFSMDYEIDLIYDETQICFFIIVKGFSLSGSRYLNSAPRLKHRLIAVLSDSNN